MKSKNREALIVLLSVDGESADRKDAEKIEGMFLGDRTIREVWKELTLRFELKTDTELRVYNLSDFMDMCNNEEFHQQDWWLTYVYRRVDVSE